MTVLALRLDLRLWVRFNSSVHIGAIEGGSDADMQLLCDAAGRFVVPGTSWTGAIRAHTEGSVEHHESGLTHWWGFVAPGVSDSGHASRVSIADSVVLADESDIEDFESSFAEHPDAMPPTPVESEPIDGVGIDRVTGAAAEGVLYSRDVLAAGSVAALNIRLEASDDDVDDAWRLASNLVQIMSSGRLTVGAAASRGLGRVRLLPERSTYRAVDFTSALSFVESLDEAAKPLTELPSSELDPLLLPKPQTQAVVSWKAVAPVMVKASIAGTVVDTLPRTARGADGKIRPILPGSSIKGVLRSTSERILATVLDLDGRSGAREELAIVPSAFAGDHQGFLSQLNHKCFELSRILYGTEGKRTEANDGSGQHRAAEPFNRAAVSVDDCLAEQAIDSDAWLKLVAPLDGKGTEPPTGFEWADRVAIDRWLGGAAEGLLYSLLEPHGITWQPIVIAVDHDRIALAGDDLGDAAWALLALTLRELAAGRVRLGFGASRGMGAIAVESTALHGLPGGSGSFELGALPEDLTRRWSTAWRSYCQEFA